MRGKRFDAAGHYEQSGITPADAGKTIKQLEEFGANQDHPRGCGENWHKAKEYGNLEGSPPRMRGKPV